MAKIITLNEESKNKLREDFEELLSKLKVSDGRIMFTKTFDTLNRKATLYFTPKAYVKMINLVQEFDKEIAWHGIAERFDSESEDAYLISDILVYPQNVTGASVTTDQEAYQTWLYERDDDSFNNIRMQGHSHVNMSTSPSTVDTALYEDILSQLTPDSFYIFLIWNKRQEKTIKIYDMQKNLLFETADVTIDIVDEDFCLSSFIADAKTMVKNNIPVYKPAAVQTNPALAKPAPAQSAQVAKTVTAGNVQTTMGSQPATKKKKKKATPQNPVNYSSAKYSIYDDDDDDMWDGFRYRGWSGF